MSRFTKNNLVKIYFINPIKNRLNQNIVAIVLQDYLCPLFKKAPGYVGVQKDNSVNIIKGQVFQITSGSYYALNVICVIWGFMVMGLFNLLYNVISDVQTLKTSLSIMFQKDVQTTPGLYDVCFI